ncbi:MULTISPECIES: MOSC domain-containing protein [Peribacillus]|uniref:MOSC domain-containing protein n=1 Tax=Peribacillus TaxID=2675229 RepID=UPI00216349EB|nr:MULTISPECIES: MOSC domain-containing protein [Peribacillus]
MNAIGHINSIIRYPVKSFQGESVTKTKIKNYGLYGDRSHVFIDESRVKQFFMATYNINLLSYKAMFEGEENDTQFPKVRIITPNGREFYWHEDECLKEFRKLTGQAHLYQKEYIPEHVPLGAIEEEHILIVNEASLKELQKRLGKPIDSRRFRPNILISLEDETPFIEDNWFGKRMKIGDVELEIKRHCERCMIINIEPDTLESDKSILKTIVKDRNNYFGVYATVIKTGEVTVGDKIFIK